MIKFLKLVFFITTFSMAVTVKKVDWVTTENDTDFNRVLTLNPMAAVFIYDSASCGFCKKFINKFFDDLLNDKYLNDHKVRFVKSDVGRSPDTKSKHKLDKKSHLVLFIKGHKLEMTNFHENLLLLLEKKINQAELLEKVRDFLHERISNISTEIETMEEFMKLMKNKEVLLAYVGDNNNRYKLYHQVARRHPEGELYHIFDKDLKNQIMRSFNFNSFPDTDCVVAFRDVKYVTSHDPDRVVYQEIGSDSIPVERFIEFERYPKYRGPEYARTNVNEIKKFGQQMLLYVRSAPINLYNTSQFKDVVKKMPKRFIFTYIDSKSEYNSVYEELFEESGVKQEHESIYIVYKMPTKKIKFEKYAGQFESDKIVEFVYKFFKDKGYLFGKDYQSFINEHLDKLNEEKSRTTETGEF